MAGRWPTSRAGCRGARTSIGSSPTGRSISTAATATRPGSTRRRSSWPGSAADTLDPDRWPDRARPRRPPDRARSRRAPGRSSPGSSRRPRPTSSSRRCAARRPTSTRWGSPTGRTPIVEPDEGGIAYPALVERGVLTRARRRRAVVGRPAWRRPDRRARRAAGARPPRPLRADQRQDHPGRVLENVTGRPARAVPRRRRPPDDEPRPEPDRPGGLRRPRQPGSMRSGSRSHFHAIGDRAVREALDAVEAARRANGPTDTRPTSPTSRSSIPTTSGGSARSAWSPTRSRYWACHEDQMDVLTIPLLGAVRAAWQYPFGSLLAAGATLAMGSDWAVSTANPLLEMEVAVTRVSDLHRGRAAALPARRTDRPDRGARGVHGRDRLGQPPRDRDRLARGRQGGGPRRPRPRPVRPRRGRDRRSAGGRHVHRRRRRPRDACARGLTRVRPGDGRMTMSIRRRTSVVAVPRRGDAPDAPRNRSEAAERRSSERHLDHLRQRTPPEPEGRVAAKAPHGVAGREAQPPRPASRAASKSLRRALAADEIDTTLPILTHWPYRV